MKADSVLCIRLGDEQKIGRKYTEEIYGTKYKERGLREKDQVLINDKHKPQEQRNRYGNPEINGKYRKSCRHEKVFVRIRRFQEKSRTREGTQAE